MAAIMRLALLGLVLCAASIGLSEQGAGNDRCRFIGLGKGLSSKAKEIKEIGDSLTNPLTGKPFDQAQKLDKIRTIAKKNPQNTLANSIKDLKLEACDKSSMRAAKDAMETIEENECHVQRQANRLREFLGVYHARAERICDKEEQEEKIQELRLARERIRRPVIELSELLDGLGPNSDLTSQLELIASKASENTLAAEFKKITLGRYDLDALKTADETMEALKQTRIFAPKEAERLRSILWNYKEQMLKNRMQDLINEWPENYGNPMEQLDEEKRTAAAHLFEIIVNYEQPKVRSDLRLLIAARKQLHRPIHKSLLIAIKDNITMEIDQELDKHPSWTYHESDVHHECDRFLYKPCEAFMALEGADAMKNFFEVAYPANIGTIMDVIGKQGNKGSNLAEWAGRWGACNWILGLNKLKITNAIIRID